MRSNQFLCLKSLLWPGIARCYVLSPYTSNGQLAREGAARKCASLSKLDFQEDIMPSVTEDSRQDNRSHLADIPKASPSQAPKDTPSPRKRKLDAVSGSSSSLSEASPLASPMTAPPPLEPGSARPSPSPSTSSDGVHQPPPAASIAQYQTFGPNPLTFDDPTVYEILPVTGDMTDEEKKEIYCVSSFPHDDLHDLIAVPRGGMDKDFSNAVKPNNQVAAHTFTAYLDNYLRPLKEEDIGFLNERVSSAKYRDAF